MNKWLLGFSLMLLWLPMHAATIVAATVSRADVQAAINSSVDGDTVVIPPGTAYYTAGVSNNNRQITIQGSGTNNTILVDEIPARTPIFKLRNTVIGSGNLLRITALQLKGGVTNTGVNFAGLIELIASAWSTNVGTAYSQTRIDHCLWYRPWGRVAYIWAYAGVLIDNNTIDLSGGNGTPFTMDGRVSGWGDQSWATPVAWGTTNEGVYIEHNFWKGNTRAITDGYAGARYVVRYNTIQNAQVQNHGTESAGRPRGTRSMESYGNQFYFSSASGQFAHYFRSGTGLVFSNNTYSAVSPGFINMGNDRDRDVCNPWGQANGINAFDFNVTNLYDSGFHTGASGVKVLVDSNKTWTVNQWIGYHAVCTANNRAQECQANSATTFTGWPPAFIQMYWTNGQPYQIRKIDKALDMPGSGYGDLLSSSATPTPVWLNQSDEPIRYWANTGPGATVVSAGGYYPIKAGRNYTNQALAGYVPLVDPHPLAGGVVVPVTNAVLSVASVTPGSGVAITVSPADLNSLGDGNTPFNRVYTTNVVVTLTAPATVGVNTFVNWRQDGVNGSTTVATNVLMDLSHTLTAVYTGPTYTLTINSTNPASGVSIQATIDNNLQAAGVTPFTRIYFADDIVTVIAPTNVSGKVFSKWQKDGSDSTFTPNSTLTMDGAHTMTAVYIVPPPPPGSTRTGHRSTGKTTRQ